MIPIRGYKKVNSVSGIYGIRCNANGKLYVGSSLDMYARTSSHISKLRRGRHENQYLQRAWDKYGEESFDVFKIAEVGHESLREQEGRLIESLGSHREDGGFNLSRYTEKKIVSDETRRKLSIAKKGHKHTEEQKKRMSESKKGIRRPRATYTFVDPEGNKVEVNDLIVFSKNNGLSNKCMISINTGNSKTHKGYRKWKGAESEISIEEYNKRLKPRKTYNTVYFYDRNGKVVMIDHLVSFCKKMKLNYGCMWNVLKGKNSKGGKCLSHRGYSRIHPSLLPVKQMEIKL